jgi:hypothetical protein
MTPVEEGTELVLRNLVTGETRSYFLVSEYYFSKKGNVLLYETTKKTTIIKCSHAVYKLDVAQKFVTIFQKFNDAKSYVMDDDGKQVAFIAERDSSSKAHRNFTNYIIIKMALTAPHYSLHAIARNDDLNGPLQKLAAVVVVVAAVVAVVEDLAAAADQTLASVRMASVCF